MMSMPSEEKPEAKHFFDDLTTDYANNVAFETTVWDLKLIFGEYSDQDKGVEWHTSVTIPWAQAKLMQYYLQINLEVYEQQHGKIGVPRTMLPPEAPLPSDPDDPVAKAFYDLAQRHRAKFMENL
jgi:hypothetical protein